MRVLFISVLILFMTVIGFSQSKYSFEPNSYINGYQVEQEFPFEVFFEFNQSISDPDFYYLTVEVGPHREVEKIPYVKLEESTKDQVVFQSFFHSPEGHIVKNTFTFYYKNGSIFKATQSSSYENMTITYQK